MDNYKCIWYHFIQYLKYIILS